MDDPVYRRVHVVVNPASGKGEPILNVLNDGFREHRMAWDASVTHRHGDAGDQARAAIADGVDLVAAYGGDGTQHEVANAVVGAAVATGRRTPMAILPGGTGNGFAREVGVPKKLRDATVMLCTSARTRRIDVGRLRSLGQAQVDDRYFIQRLYIGVEPEEQTSREDKDRMTGKGLKVAHGYAIDDGLLDCFVLDKANVDTFVAAAARALDLHTAASRRYYRQAHPSA